MALSSGLVCTFKKMGVGESSGLVSPPFESLDGELPLDFLSGLVPGIVPPLLSLGFLGDLGFGSLLL